jgi:hypothetical protein
LGIRIALRKPYPLQLRLSSVPVLASAEVNDLAAEDDDVMPRSKA